MKGAQAGAWRPWLALLALCAVFELPSIVQPDRLSLSGVRLPGDVLLLVNAGLALHGSRGWRVARALLTTVAAVLVLYRVDSAVCQVLMRHPPQLYDQVFLLRHLAVLLMDLWGGWAWLAAAGAIALMAGLAWLASRLLEQIVSGFAPLRANSKLVALGSLWVAFLVISALGSTAVRWTAPELVQNAVAARRLSQHIARGIERSPYLAYASITLTHKPNIYIFFVESYGRVMASDPSTAGAWREALRSMQDELGAAGYHFASAYAEAPVSGGRSWLAHASIFTGMHVDFQALYQSLFPGGRVRVPQLPGFLRRQGYRTVLLSPADRARPGVHLDNPYDYAEIIRSRQLSYRGPLFGWGRIPDQYSMAYAQEHVFGQRDRPLFFVFTMVSSHATWRELPTFVDDPLDAREYQPGKARGEPQTSTGGESHGTIVDQTRRYARDVRKRAATPASSELRARYAQSILYDLELLHRTLTTLRGDDLILVLGDHQPPLVTSERDDFAAPIHAFARDPRLLAELLEHGFVPSLALGQYAKTALPQEALFSLLVRTLVRAGTPETTLPPYLPHGVRLAD